MERSHRGTPGHPGRTNEPQAPVRTGGGSVTASLPVSRKRDVEISDVKVMRDVLTSLTVGRAPVIARDKDEAKEAKAEAQTDINEGEWNAAYGRKSLAEQYGNERGYIGEDQSWYEMKDGKKVKKTLHHADMKPASETESKDGKKGAKMNMSAPISADDIAYIITDPNLSPEEKTEVAGKAAALAGNCNEAFKAMDLDTLEAQALYLAHSAVESRNWRTMGAQADPAAVGQFKGRGPLQTTFQQNYVKSLAYMDAQAKQLEDGGRKDEAKKLREASAAIKKDPAAAEDPKYAFLMSGAMMHAAGGVEKSAELAGGKDPTFPGNGPEDTWMSGGANNDQKIGHWTSEKAKGNKDADERLEYWNGVKKASGRKNTAYDRAVERLSKYKLADPDTL